MAHSSRSWCQSAEFLASREHSRPSTIPARPRETSATSCWNPSLSAAEAPDWPWSMSITVIWSLAQPNAIAFPRRSYWRIADPGVVDDLFERGLADIQQRGLGQVSGGFPRRSWGH